MARLRGNAEAEWDAMRWYLLLIALIFTMLLARLLMLQVVFGARHRLESLDNIIRSVKTAPPRGDILDRAGRQLAKSANNYSLLYIPPEDIDRYYLSDKELDFLRGLSDEQAAGLSYLSDSQAGKLKTIVSGKLAELREQIRLQQGFKRKYDKLSDEQRAVVASVLAQSMEALRRRVGQELEASGEDFFKASRQAKGGSANGAPELQLERQRQALVSLSGAQLKLFNDIRGNPLALREDILAAVRQQQGQPYLHRKTGQALREIVHLAAYLDTSYAALMQRLGKERIRVPGYQPLTLVDQLTQKQVVYLGENISDFQGVLIEKYGFKRSYPLEGLAAHLVGYTGLVTDTDPPSIKALGYGPREQVGKEGVERAFEHLLHGAGGQRDIEVDRKRVFQKVVREVPPKKGSAAYLTIDKEIQAQAQRVLGGRPGAVIVCSLAPGRQGEILALASSPSFDPNRFAETNYYAGLLTNKNLPLLNRAYRHAFPPGSTFKTVTATAALQTGKDTPGTGFYCPGKKQIGNRAFKCHDEFGHKSVNLLQAIAHSCDVAFYTIGLGLDDPPETIKRFAEYFGFGSPTGIELPGELSGVVPDERWKREHFAKLGYGEVDQSWYMGDTANYAIGQGFLTATPLQVLWSSNLVALGGTWYPPRLLYAREVDGKVIPEREARPYRRPLDPEALADVREGMRLAVTQGTCKLLSLAGMSVCAKSGTAETGRRGEADHAWVTGFYPLANPRYGFVCFFQNGGSSGDTAIPAARQLLLYLRGYKPPTSSAD